MSRFSLRALAAASLVLALSACDSTGTDAPLVPEAPPVVASSPVALPLAVGNEWTYRETVTRFERDGFTVRSVDTLATPATLRVVETVDINGETWYRFAATSVLRSGFESFIYTNRADGLYSRPRDGSGRATRQIAFPAQAGERYGVSGWPGTLDNREGISFDTDITLKVTDLPVQIGSEDYEGYLYTGAIQRFRLSSPTTDFLPVPGTPPYRQLVVPNVGYAQYEAAYVELGDPGFFRVSGKHSFRLTSFTLAQTPA